MAKKNQISLANVISVVGVVSLGVLTYLGQVLLSGGAIGTSIIWAVGVAVVAAALLIVMIRAKGAESHFGMWKIVEGITLVLYAVVAIFTASMSVHFFVVTGNKEELKKEAKQDIEAIEGLYNEFIENRYDAIDNTIVSVRTYNSNGSEEKQTESDVLDNLKAEGLIYSDKIDLSDIDEFEAILERAVVEPVELKWEDNLKENLKKWNAQIENWSLFYLPGIAAEMSEYYDELKLSLAEHAGDTKLWTLDGDGNIAEDDQVYEPSDYTMKFGDMLKSATGDTVIGWVVIAVIHIMIIFNYVVAYRSPTTMIGGKRRRRDDGGISL